MQIAYAVILQLSGKGCIPYTGWSEYLIIQEVNIMKVQNITDIDKFFKTIDSCRGKVELVTGEGDRLNLKSKLSQYVSMANLFSDGTIEELEIVAYEPEDINKLINFMVNG